MCKKLIPFKMALAGEAGNKANFWPMFGIIVSSAMCICSRAMSRQSSSHSVANPLEQGYKQVSCICILIRWCDGQLCVTLCHFVSRE